MIFLIEYNRREGLIVDFVAFPDSERAEAEKRRLEKELSLNRRGIRHEVVLLEAMSKEALRKTHRRYFEDPSQIVKSS